VEVVKPGGELKEQGVENKAGSVHPSCERLCCVCWSERCGQPCLTSCLKGRAAVTPTARTEERGRESAKRV